MIFFLFKAITCRAILVIVCLKQLNQCHLKLYHYTSLPHFQLDRGLGFYMLVEADDRTRRLGK